MKKLIQNFSTTDSFDKYVLNIYYVDGPRLGWGHKVELNRYRPYISKPVTLKKLLFFLLAS